MDPSFDIEKHIAAKIEEATNDRRVLRETIDGVQAKLEVAYVRIGGKPKETDDELAKQMKDLEFWHSTTTQDNASERKYMLDMDKLKKRRVALVEYAKLQESIDAMKMHKKEFQQQLRDKEKHIDELHQAGRKVKTATKIGCNPAEVVERVVAANEDQIPVGLFRQLSEGFGVDVSSTRIGGARAVRVQGVATAVDAAFVRIDQLLQNVATQISVSNSTIYCLLMMNAVMLSRIEKDHSVRIDLSRSALTCKVAGLPESVAAAIAEIQSIQSLSLEVKYENSALPFIIGKAGAGLRSIEQENCVHLDINRERNVIVVTGFVDDVTAAAELIKDAADGNRSVEEILKIPRHIFLGCLQRDGAALLKTARAEYPAVVIQTLKALEKQQEKAPVVAAAASNGTGRPAVAPPKQSAIDAAIGVDKTGEMSTDSFEFLLFKGPAMRALPARNFIQAALDVYMSDMVCVKGSNESLGFVVGKKGVRIDAIRKQYPTASIDVGLDTVYIQSPSADDRVAIQRDVQQIINENAIETITTTEECVKSLVSAKAVETRDQLEKTLNLNFQVDIDSTSIKFRGHRDSIAEGISIIREYEISHSVEEMPVSDEDCAALSSGGAESVSREFEKQFNVEIYVGRKNNVVKIRGHKDSIAAASAAISRMLAGEAGSESQLIPYDTADLRFLIGKGGETIGKFEKDNDVRIDILKSSGFMRVRGKSAERVTTAVKSISNFLGDVTDVQRVPVPPISSEFSGDVLRKHIAETKEMFGVKVLAAPTAYGYKAPAPGKRRKPGDKREKKFEKAEEYDVGLKTESLVAEAADGESEGVNDVPVSAKEVVRDKVPENVVALQGKRRILMPAVKFLESLISGVESYSYQLSKDQFKLAHPLLASQSRKAGIEKFGVTLRFDVARCLVILENGVSSGMLKSKGMLFRFLDEFLPGQFASVPLPAACISYFSANEVDKSIAKVTESTIQYDYHFSCVRVSCYGSEDNVKNAVDMIEAHRSEWSERCIVIVLEDHSIIPYLVGKGGAFISDVEKSSSVSVQIDAKNLHVTIQAESKENCKAGEVKVLARIAQYAKEHWKVDVSDLDALGSLIGKGGSKINQLRADTGANIEISMESGSIRVTGSEQAVLKARDVIQTELAGHLDNNSVVKLNIPIAAFPLIVGKKGATIRELQTSTEVRKIDLNRETEQLIIRGSTKSCALAESKVKAMLEEAGFNKEPATIIAPPEPQVVEDKPALTVKILPNGAYMKTNGVQVVLSKSHLKRQRRREAIARGEIVGVDNEEEEEEEEEYPTQKAELSTAAAPADTKAAALDAQTRDAALTALLTDLGVSTLSIESKASPTPFTPFSGPSMVPSPVYDNLSPVAKTSSLPPPGIAQPVRSMRSARVGIIGSAGAIKPANSIIIQDDNTNRHDHSVVVSAPVGAMSVSVDTAPLSSADELLSLLLSDSGSSSSKAGTNSSFSKNSTAAPSKAATSGSADHGGYYKSKGGFSVRLS